MAGGKRLTCLRTAIAHCLACGETHRKFTWRCWMRHPATSPSSASPAKLAGIQALPRAIPPQSGWSAQFAICSVSKQWIRPIRGPGLILDFLECAASARQQGSGTQAYPVQISAGGRRGFAPRFRLGPVHAGIIEPGHFRFTANGEHVVRLEQRLGWVHKGIESLMNGATLVEAARLASRASGDSTVAYAYAFAQAAEAAMQVKVPTRAAYLRALMSELERLANHFGDILGAICNDASFSLMYAQCGILRERTLRAADACFGHRLMMDIIVPGGVSRELAPEGAAQVKDLLGEVRHVFPRLIELYDNKASLQDSYSHHRNRNPGTGTPSSAPAVMLDAPLAVLSMRAVSSHIPPTTGSPLRCRCSTPVMSMRESGYALVRLSRACR